MRHLVVLFKVCSEREKLLGSVAGVTLLGVIDYLTGSEISFSIFYLVPVGFVTWWIGRREGILVSLLSALTWLIADIAASPDPFSSTIPAWNATVRLAFFVSFVVLLAKLRESQVREREILTAVQRSLLPTTLPTIPGLEIAGAWQPAQAVGGDYYDVIPLGDKRVALSIGDVSGKGVDAAIIMSNLQAAVRVLARNGVSPRRLCRRLNDHLTANVPNGRFVTFFYGIIDTRRRTLHYCNAGHLPPIMVRATGQYERLDGGGPVLGVFPAIQYFDRHVSFRPGDRVFLFTDGVSEARNRQEEEFGEQRLVEFLDRSRGAPGNETLIQLVGEVSAFHQSEFEDDVTMLIATFSANAKRTRDPRLLLAG